MRRVVASIDTVENRNAITEAIYERCNLIDRHLFQAESLITSSSSVLGNLYGELLLRAFVSCSKAYVTLINTCSE